MTRSKWLAAWSAAAALMLLPTFASAQPEAGPPPGTPSQDGPPPGPPPHDHPRPPHEHRRPPFDPLRRALDANGDHELSSDEIANAASTLKALDKNGDGKIDREELRPPMPPGMHRREKGGDGDRGTEGRRGPPDERRGPKPEGEGEERRGPQRSEMPGAEMFVERLMEFDTDADGKLDRSELTIAAKTMAERRKEFMEKMGRWMGERRRP